MNSSVFPFGRVHRLAPSSTSEGVSCDEDGPRVGPVRLLRRTWFGFEPRPQAELEFVLGEAYGAPVKLAGRMAELEAIAKALDAGNLATAMIVTLHMRLPAF